MKNKPVDTLSGVILVVCSLVIIYRFSGLGKAILYV